jgi:hypothetical protein
MFVNPATEELSVKREDGAVVSLETSGGGGAAGDITLVTSVIQDRGATPSSGWLNGRDEVSHQIGDLILFTWCRDPADNGLWEVTGFVFGIALITLKRPDGWTDGTILQPKLQIIVDRGDIGEGSIWYLENDITETTVGSFPLWFTNILIKAHWIQNGVNLFDRDDDFEVRAFTYGRDTEFGNAEFPFGFFPEVETAQNTGNAGMATFMTHEVLDKTITAKFPTDSPPIFTFTFGQADLDEAYNFRSLGMGTKHGEYGVGYTWLISMAGFNAASAHVRIQYRLNNKTIWGFEEDGLDVDNDASTFQNDNNESNGNWGLADVYNDDQQDWSLAGAMHNPPLQPGDILEVRAWSVATGTTVINDIVLWIVPQAWAFVGMASNNFTRSYVQMPPTVKDRGYEERRTNNNPSIANTQFFLEYINAFPRSSDDWFGDNYYGQGHKGGKSWIAGYGEDQQYGGVAGLKGFPLPFFSGSWGAYTFGN